MERTEGIILSSKKIGESDILFSIFTRDFGKISCVAQGVRKNESRLRSILQVGALVDFHFMLLRSGRFRLTSPSLTTLYPSGTARESALPIFLESLMMLDRTVLDGEKDMKLWDLLLYWAHALSQTDKEKFQKDQARIWFLGNLMAVLGHMSERDREHFSGELTAFFDRKTPSAVFEKISHFFAEHGTAILSL